LVSPTVSEANVEGRPTISFTLQGLDEEAHEMVLTEHHTIRFGTHQLTLKSLFDQRRKFRPNPSGALQTELWYCWVAENNSPCSSQTLPMPSPETP
jgi:hypothetical protein